MDRLFTDQASRKVTQRPQLISLRAFKRKRDTVVVHGMDRLADEIEPYRLH